MAELGLVNSDFCINSRKYSLDETLEVSKLCTVMFTWDAIAAVAKWAAGAIPFSLVVWLMIRPRLRLGAPLGRGECGDYRQVVLTNDQAQSSGLITRNPSTPAVSSAGVSLPGPQAMYIRVALRNFGWVLPAKHCRVFVNRITLDEKVVEESGAKLAWKGLHHLGEEFSPQVIDSAQTLFVDVCGAHEVNARLSTKSLRELEGYPGFTKTGTYIFEIVATGDRFCERGTLALGVRYNGQWNETEVVSVERTPWWRRWT